MPSLLELDTTEELNNEAGALEEESWSLGSTDGAPDLSHGGMVNGVRVRPARDKNVERGRPAARRAWMANGTESLLPLAWDPDGLVHDSGARYFRKRLCLCCHRGGFKGTKCPACVKNDCSLCDGSADRKKIIPCFYRRLEDVPFPSKIYGSIDCFLVSCIRRGKLGFLNEVDMRLHARSRHKLEYQAYTEALAANKTDEIAELKQRLDTLMLNMAQNGGIAAVSISTISKAEVPKRARTPGQTKAQKKYQAKQKLVRAEVRRRMHAETRADPAPSQ